VSIQHSLIKLSIFIPFCLFEVSSIM
jgi:hypothetical protein